MSQKRETSVGGNVRPAASQAIEQQEEIMHKSEEAKAKIKRRWRTQEQGANGNKVARRAEDVAEGDSR